MDIDDHLLKCVGFIGAPEAQGFVADGTCFFVSLSFEEEGFHYAVTARHLVRPTVMGGGELLPLDGTVRVRVERQNKPPKVIPTVRGDWVCHPDRWVDVCVYPFDLRKWDEDDDLDLMVLHVGEGERSMVPALNTHHPSSIPRLGDPVFITSLFTGHPGEKRNIPIVRLGNIAATPTESIRVSSPRRPAYLVETHSLGGTSGAPVFLHANPYYRWNGLPQYRERTRCWLAGMVISNHSGNHQRDFEALEQDAPVISKDSDFNSGISVVLPIQAVMEVINGTELREARVATIEAIKKQSGFRPSSAKRGEPKPAADNEANPMHREDFKTLLGGASKTTRQAD